MIEYRGLKYSNSIIACACAYITMKYFKMENYKICYAPKLFNTKKGVDYGTTNTNDIIKACAKDICFFCDALNKGNLYATKKKYSSENFGNVVDLIYTPGERVTD